MKIITRLSQVAVAGAVLALPLTGHAALIGWSGWTHQLYVGGGAGFQYINNKTSIGNAYNSNNFITLGFHNHRYAGVENLDVGLANSMGKNYWAVEADAVYTSADNTASSTDALATEFPVYNYYSYSANLPWRYELDGIMGYYVQPNVLAYGKLGATMGRMYTLFIQNQNPSGAGGTVNGLNKILYGVVFGAGGQYVLSQHWRIGAEADLVQFFNAHKSDAGYTYGPASMNQQGSSGLNYQIRQWNFVAKATVNYLF